MDQYRIFLLHRRYCVGINYLPMKEESQKSNNNEEDPLVPEVFNYLNKFDFHLALFIQRKFKIGFSRAERILKQIEAKKITVK